MADDKVSHRISFPLNSETTSVRILEQSIHIRALLATLLDFQISLAAGGAESEEAFEAACAFWDGKLQNSIAEYSREVETANIDPGQEL